MAKLKSTSAQVPGVTPASVVPVRTQLTVSVIVSVFGAATSVEVQLSATVKVHPAGQSVESVPDTPAKNVAQTVFVASLPGSQALSQVPVHVAVVAVQPAPHVVMSAE